MAEDKNPEKDVWKTVYTVDDLDGGSCTFDELAGALAFAESNIENIEPDELESADYELKIRIHRMTEQQIAAMPEYNP